MKISIIGAGAVGTEITNYLWNMASISQIVLIDKNKKRAEGEVLDFAHTRSFTYSKNTRLMAGDLSDTKDSDIVVVTASVPAQNAETRADLLNTNSKVIHSIMQDLDKYCPNAFIIVVSNPVDVMAYQAIIQSNFAPNKIVSSGTILDTARVMEIIGEELVIDPKNITAMVLGEHGESCVFPWSLFNIFGMSVNDFCAANNYKPLDLKDIEKRTVQAGYEIHHKKGNTDHGIAAAVYRIIRAMNANEDSILPVGVFAQGEYEGIKDVVLSLPCIVNKNGIHKILKFNLLDEELKKLQESANKIKSFINEIK